MLAGEISELDAQAALTAVIETVQEPIEGQETARRFDQLDNVELGEELKQSTQALTDVTDVQFAQAEAGFDGIDNDAFDRAAKRSVEMLTEDEAAE